MGCCCKEVSPAGSAAGCFGRYGLVSCLAAMVVGLVLQVVGMSTVAWITGGDSGVEVGLFVVKTPEITIAIPHEGMCPAGQARVRIAQGGSILAVIISVVYLIHGLVDKCKSKVPSPCWGCLFLFLLTVSTVATWAVWVGWYLNDPCRNEAPKDTSNLGYSFALYLIGSILSIAACTVHLLKRSVNSDAPQFSPIGDVEKDCELQYSPMSNPTRQPPGL